MGWVIVVMLSDLDVVGPFETKELAKNYVKAFFKNVKTQIAYCRNPIKGWATEVVW